MTPDEQRQREQQMVEVTEFFRSINRQLADAYVFASFRLVEMVFGPLAERNRDPEDAAEPEVQP